MDEYKIEEQKQESSHELFNQKIIISTTHSLSDRIIYFCNCYNNDDLAEMKNALYYLSDNISHLEIYDIPNEITISFIQILFALFYDFFKQGDPETFFENPKPDYLINIINIIANLVKFLPFEYFPSEQLLETALLCFHSILVNKEEKKAPALLKSMDIFFPILINMTSRQEFWTEINQLITFENIDGFYVNPLINSNQKENILKIFINILHNCDVTEEDFPLGDSFLLITHILHNFDSKHTFLFIRIIYLLLENPLIATRIMTDITFTNFINSCLNTSFLKSIYQKDTMINEIQFCALKSISLILNLDEYSIDFDVSKVIELSQCEDNPDLMFAAMETLQNFVDCEQHAHIMLECQIFNFLLESFERGTSKVKLYAYKILINLVFYTSADDVSFLLSVNALHIVVDFLESYDDVTDINTALVGLLHFLQKAAILGHSIDKIFEGTDLGNCLDGLHNKIDDEDVMKSIEALIDFAKSSSK